MASLEKDVKANQLFPESGGVVKIPNTVLTQCIFPNKQIKTNYY